MSKTLANLRENTRTYLDEATATDFTATEVDFEINYAYHQIFTAIIEVYEEYYTTSTTFNIVANQQEYDTGDGLPTDLFKIRRVEVTLSSASNASPQRALPVSFDDVSRDLGNTSLGTYTTSSPAYYFYGDGTNAKLGFVPVPAESVTNGCKLWYVKIVSDLSSASDTVEIPYADRFAWLIPLRAAATLLRKGQQEESAANNYINQFHVELERMKQTLEDRVADDAKHVIDSTRETTDFGDMAINY